MKVFIKTEGGRNIGFGHLTRCISIYEAFLEENIKPIFIVDGFRETRDFLRKNKINSFYDIKAKVSNEDIFIIDSYKRPPDFYEETLGKVKLLVSIDDFKRMDYPGGVVVNGSIYGKNIRYGQKGDVKYLKGPEYIPLRRNFWEAEPKDVRAGLSDVMITCGGTRDNSARKTAEFLLKNYVFNLHIVTLAKRTRRANSGREFFYNSISAEQMKRLMLTVDACVSGGGQTTYELARLGVPTLGICFAQNQLLNLKGGEAAGYLKFVGWHDEPDILEKIGTTLNFLGYKERLKMSRVGQRAVDGQGARRLVRKILDYAQN